MGCFQNKLMIFILIALKNFICYFVMVSLTCCLAKNVAYRPKIPQYMTRIVKPAYYIKMHSRCRNNYYPGTNNEVKRMNIPDNRVSWYNDWPQYSPPTYTSESIIGKPWADFDISEELFYPLWNRMDGNVNRISHMGMYSITQRNYPLNPCGRTGLKGRGRLGRWGPNHAADSIVTRWKRDDQGSKIISETSKPILQFVAIKRKDTGEWAIPGGMVDVGESPEDALKREFLEEALNSLEMEKTKFGEMKKRIEEIFSNATIVYKGYVDDPRNTDNAWMETVAMHAHDDGLAIGCISLTAGDDAASVAWIDLCKSLNLYASHITFFQEVVRKLDAHW